MSGALGSAVTGCDVVNGGGKASDGGEPKIFFIEGRCAEGKSDVLHSALSGSM